LLVLPGRSPNEPPARPDARGREIEAHDGGPQAASGDQRFDSGANAARRLGATDWLRRALSISLYAGLWAVLLLASPALVALTAALDLARGRPWPTLRCFAFFFLYLSCEVAGIAASFALWLARGPWTGTDAASYHQANFILQCWWARRIFRGAERIFAMTTRVEGGELVAGGPFLLFLRHASVGDTVLPANFVSDRYGIRLRYVLKRELLWDPCLDIVGNRLPNCFVRRDSPDSRREIAAVKRLAENLGRRDGVLIYPEGTRFSAAKRARIVARLRRGDDAWLAERAAALRHVLPPRLGGTLGLLESNPGADVVFCAHVGFEGAGSFRDLLSGSLVRQVIRLRFWRVPFGDVPADAARRKEWLLDWWKRLDDWIDAEKGGGAKATPSTCSSP
jgi:1-acyl-sn-glycerol-3-phosphate acyltransferase